jgi:glycosyltransferase involved in cell wall biosynthesis
MQRSSDSIPRAPSPQVSVIVPNYNGAAYLVDSVGSACRQTLRNIEIIVSDDASTDGSVAIVERLMAVDDRIRLVKSEQNGGPAAARNKALDVAGGEWIAVMDSDDFMHPRRLEILLDAAANDAADLVADDLLIFDNSHDTSPSTLLTGRWAQRPFWIDTAEYVRLNILYERGPVLGYLKPVFRSSLFAKSGIRYDESLRIAQDYDLVLRVLHFGVRLRVYPLLLYFYRRHSASNSFRLNSNAVKALEKVNLEFRSCIKKEDRRLLDAVDARARSLDTALAFITLRDSLKSKDWSGFIRAALKRPRALLLFKASIEFRLRRIFSRAMSEAKMARKCQVCLLASPSASEDAILHIHYPELLASSLPPDFDIHLLCLTPAIFGLNPVLGIAGKLPSFKTIRVRGAMSWGRYTIMGPNSAKQAIAAAAKGLLARIRGKSAAMNQPVRGVTERLTRNEQLFIARYAPRIGDVLIAGRPFVVDALPYALRPDAVTGVIVCRDAEGVGDVARQTTSDMVSHEEHTEFFELNRNAEPLQKRSFDRDPEVSGST